MRLAFFISSLDAGGAERVLSNLASHMAKAGHHVTIVTLSASPPFYVLHQDIQLIQLKKTSPALRNWPFMFKLFAIPFVVRHHIKVLKPDVVISFMDLMNMLVLASKLGLNVPVVISERTHPHMRPLPRYTRWLFNAVRDFLYRFATTLVVQTATAAKCFPASCQKKIHIIPNAVETVSAPKTEHRSHATQLVSIGRLDFQKDHKTLILAMAELVKKHPDLQLTIYGEGEEKENHLRLIASLKLEQNVHLPGLTKNTSEVLKAADIFVFPSLCEGFPNALCEAMAMGLPIVSSNCSGNVDVVQDGVNGVLFQAGDKAALISALAELINDQAQRVKLAAEAMKLPKTYNADKVFKSWEEVIYKCVK